MGEKDSFLPSDQRLTGAANITAWILTITAILLSLGLDEFLKKQPEGLSAEAQKRWDLNTASDHARAYGHIAKNIADTAIQEEALHYRDECRPLHEFMTYLRTFQRGQSEINADLSALKWQTSDTIESFFKRGRALFNEMRRSCPGVLSETTFLDLMLNKLPESFTPASAALLLDSTKSINSACTYLKHWEAQMSIKDGSSRPNNTKNAKGAGASSSTVPAAGGAGSSSAPAASNLEMAFMAQVKPLIKDSINKALRAQGGVQKHQGGRSGGKSGGDRSRRGGYGGGGGSCSGDRDGNNQKRCFNCGSPYHLSPACPHGNGGGRHGDGRQGGGYGGHGGGHGGGRNDGGHNHNHNHQHQHNNNNNNYNYTCFPPPPPSPHIPSEAIFNQPVALVDVNHSNAFCGLKHDAYLLDSAATAHISNNKSHFTDLHPLPGGRSDVVMTGAGPLTVEGYGTVNVYDALGNGYNMKQVMFVPSSPVCLFSTIRLNMEGGTFSTTNHSATLMTENGTLKTYAKYKGIYSLLHLPAPEFHAALRDHGKAGATFETWHARFGHVGFSTLAKLLHGSYVAGLKLIGNILDKCTCRACQLGKFKKTPYPTQTRTFFPLEVLHTDICGPLPTSLNSKKYFITLRDRGTGYTLASCLAEKSEAASFIKQTIALLERKTPYKVKAIRLDRAGENISLDLRNWLKDRGIEIQLTATECSESNGTSERLNLTIMDRVRATLIHSNQPRLLWPWAVHHIVTAMNFLPYKSTNLTPHESLFGQKPDVGHLRPFGAKVDAWTPTQAQLDKLSPRASDGRLVGYVDGSTHMYQVGGESGSSEPSLSVC